MSENRSLLLNGLGLTLRRFPALFWAFVFNLAFSALTTARIAHAIGHFTDNSLAARPLHHGFDLGTIAFLAVRLNQGAGLNPSFGTNIVLFLATYFLLIPGTLFCYQADSPARLSTLFQQGWFFFWRFVRILILTVIGFAIVLCPLVVLQNKWSAHVEERFVGFPQFLYGVLGYLVILLVASLLRLYFDLVEVYTVQVGQQLRGNGDPDHRVRRALIPAARALGSHFVRAYGSFLLLTLIGVAAVVLTARVAMHSLAHSHVWPMFLLAQGGLFLMLLTRFWQRGAETILSQDNPIFEEAEEEPVSRASFIPRDAAPLVVRPEPIADLPLEDPIPDPEPETPSLAAPDDALYTPEVREPGRADSDPASQR